MDNSIYDEKLIILELDFYNIYSLNLDKKISIARMLRHLSSCQNLLILSDSPIDFIKKTIKHWNLNSGIIVANSGSCQYNLSLKKITFQKFLDFLIAKCIIKYVILNNLNFVINTKSNGSFIYKFNSWFFLKFKTLKSRLMKFENRCLNDWENVENFLKKSRVSSLEIFFNSNISQKRKTKIKIFLKKFSSIFNFQYFVNDYVVYIFSHEASRTICLNMISKNKQINLTVDSLYLCVDQMSDEIVEKCFFTIASHKLIDLCNKKTTNLKTLVDFSMDEGKDNWINFLNNHTYLWQDNLKNDLNNIFKFYLFLNVKNFIMDGVLRGIYKVIFITENNDVVINKYSKFKFDTNWFKRNFISESLENSTPIFVWKNNINLILSFLKNKKINK